MRRDELERLLGPDLAPGFINSPRFLKLEQRGAVHLEDYSDYILESKWTQDYLDGVRSKLPQIIGRLMEGISREDMLGRCADACTMVLAVLRKADIWALGIRGDLYVTDRLGTQGLSMASPTPGQHAGHEWVIAPPFLIDVTLGAQRLRGSAEFPLHIVIDIGAEGIHHPVGRISTDDGGIQYVRVKPTYPPAGTLHSATEFRPAGRSVIAHVESQFPEYDFTVP